MSKILVLGTADWNQPIATNQHYVVRELAQEFSVIYTESMGLRTPELKLRDIRRMARRIGIGRRVGNVPQRTVPSGVEVRSPKVLPRHIGLAAKLNRPRVQSLVADWINQEGPRLLWTYTPVTYGLEKLATDVVYHCVDLLAHVDRIPEALIDASERELSRYATAALGTSRVVVEHLKHQGFADVTLWSNVADTVAIGAARPTTIQRVPRRVVFAGNLSATKVDFKLLARLLDAGIDLHLAGPIAEGGGRADREVDALVRRGATYHGMLGRADLAALYWTAQVGLIPYVLNDYTRGVSPLKTYEYLAAGLGVVSTPVPSVAPLHGHVEVASDPVAFVTATRRLLATVDAPTIGARAELAESHSWTARGEQVRALAEAMTV